MKRKRDDIPNYPGVEWTEEHLRAWNFYIGGDNIAMLGPGGAGKTTFIQAVLERERWKREDGIADITHVLLTGSTGVSAFNIGGTTAHDVFNVYNNKESAVALSGRMSHNKRETIKNATLWISDEISMTDADLLKKFDDISRCVRGKDEPFGGLQVIFLGDPLQIPPVVKFDGNPRNRNTAAVMMYNSPSWDDAQIKTIVLSRVFRQDNPNFVNALLAIREGVWTPNAIKFFNECSKTFEERNIDVTGFITHIYPRRDTAQKQNDIAMAKLDGEVRIYRMKFAGNSARRKAFIKAIRSPETLALKIGANVMLTKNIDVRGGMPNGAKGVVCGLGEDFVDVNFFRNVGIKRITAVRWAMRDADGETSATQIPLVLAYAFVMHKVQGLTIDWLCVHLDGVWELSQVYVSLSRVRSPENLWIVCKNFDSVKKLEAPYGVKKFLHAAENAKHNK